MPNNSRITKNQRQHKQINQKQTLQNSQTHFRTPFCRAHGLRPFGRAAKNKDSEIRQKKIQKMSHKIGGDTGVNEQVTKPIQPDILQRILQEIISRQMI